MQIASDVPGVLWWPDEIAPFLVCQKLKQPRITLHKGTTPIAGRVAKFPPRGSATLVVGKKAIRDFDIKTWTDHEITFDLFALPAGGDFPVFVTTEWSSYMEMISPPVLDQMCANAGISLATEMCVCKEPTGHSTSPPCKSLATLKSACVKQVLYPQMQAMGPPRIDLVWTPGPTTCAPGQLYWSAKPSNGESVTAQATLDGVALTSSPVSRVIDAPMIATVAAGNDCFPTVSSSISITPAPYVATLSPQITHALIGNTLSSTITLDCPAKADVQLAFSTSLPNTFQTPTLTIRAGKTTATAQLDPLPGVIDIDEALGLRVTMTGGDGVRHVSSPGLTLDLVRASGLADFHNHQFGNLGFGGTIVWGDPRGTLEKSFPVCGTPGAPHHAQVAISLLSFILPIPVPLGSDAESFANGGNGMPHEPFGWPAFATWNATSWAQQGVHREMLLRAHTGGLRLLVMLAVNNHRSCMARTVIPQPDPGCQDDHNAYRQLEAAHALQAEIDAECGGGECGWYRIATSATDARRFLNEGKLVVVLGVEVDRMLEAYQDGTKTLGEDLDAYWSRGARHFFPIHFHDNAFGGHAQMGEPLLDLGDAVPCSDPDLEGPIVPFLQPGGSWKHLPACARDGLTAKGEALLTKLMKRGALIDIDHMSDRASRKALDLMKARAYPAISGHSAPTSILSGKRRSEGSLNDAELQDVLDGGGAIALITNQGHDGFVRMDPSLAYPNKCNPTSETFAQPLANLLARGVRAVGFGTDFNGGIAQPHARRCAQQARDVKYPFAAPGGIALEKQQLGTRQFHVSDDGLINIGMLPDFVEDLAIIWESRGRKRSEVIDPLMRAADAYVRAWERAERAGAQIP